MSKDGALFIWHSEIMTDSDPADNMLPNSDVTDSSKKKLKKGLYRWMKHAKCVITLTPLIIT